MKKLIPVFTFLLLFACNQKESKIVIKGKIDHIGDSNIYLQELTIDGKGTIDSIFPGAKGSFRFVRKISWPSYYTLRVGQQRPIILLAMPGERITVSGIADSLFQTYTVAGSEESERVRTLTRRLDRTTQQLDSINGVYRQFLNNPNIAQIKATLTMNFNRVIDEQRLFTISFIEQDPKSFANIMALYQKIDQSNFVLYADDDIKYFEQVDSVMFKMYPDAPYEKTLHGNVAQMKEQQRVNKLKQMLTNMGAPAPDIALPSPKGDTIRLSSLKGKIVLLDFWASWCPPCRQENPNLVKIYNQYKSQGFTIYQVSLDKTRDAWLKAIQDDHLTWTHVSDLKYWDSPVVKLYNVDAIPASFLIDRDGTIVARNLRGDDLAQRIEMLLKQK